MRQKNSFFRIYIQDGRRFFQMLFTVTGQRADKTKRSKDDQLEIVEPFQELLDELNEFFKWPGNDPDGGEGDLLGHRVSGIDGAGHVRSPF
jgi:hypothetical protein